ncbi:bisdemethoxycurcumin synthase-like [Miscanthus floridulus]|uniref:bisdemethoxycurcumin synthase-like n=1 Tax=Miscanthus floridulus TaxID=154761 RepID=UPI0034598004
MYVHLLIVLPLSNCDRFTSSASRRPADIADETRHRQRAALLGIGTANPANCVRQDEYADWYFNVTGSEHLTHLKTKMKRMCDKSGIHRRYFHHSESTIREHPILLGRGQPSLDARQDKLASAVPVLAAAAAEDAIAEWGRPATDITDLVVSTYSGAHMPGADLRLASLLGLRPSVRRTVLYLQGCTAGGAVLRVAKDIAENNPGARVLVACAELTLVMFRAPDDACPGTLVMQSMFADGASAAVVGARAEEPVELPIYEMVSASQFSIPETSDGRAAGVLNEAGLVFQPSRGIPALVRQNIERCMADALRPLGLGDGGGGGWNDLFWAVQPSGRAILDAVEAGLVLEEDKLAASRRVLREYGYMSGASMIFVLDELRRRSAGELGVMLAIGPGISVETMVLRVAGARESSSD